MYRPMLFPVLVCPAVRPSVCKTNAGSLFYRTRPHTINSQGKDPKPDAKDSDNNPRESSQHCIGEICEFSPISISLYVSETVKVRISRQNLSADSACLSVAMARRSRTDGRTDRRPYVCLQCWHRSSAALAQGRRSGAPDSLRAGLAVVADRPE